MRYKNTDAVPIKESGEWGFDGMGWTCSECGEYALFDKYKQAAHSDFCPRCGAKMERSNENAE